MSLFQFFKKVLVTLLLTGLLAGCGGGSAKIDSNVQLVKNGSFNKYPSVKIGVAFDKFFDKPQWKSFKANSGEKVVEFNGGCLYMDKPIAASLQFIIKEDSSFEMGALEFNGVPQNLLVKAVLIEKIFGSYSKPEEAVKTSQPVQPSKPKERLDASFDQEKRPAQVPGTVSRLMDEDYSLAGLKLGNTLSDAEKVFGNPISVESLKPMNIHGGKNIQFKRSFFEGAEVVSSKSIEEIKITGARYSTTRGVRPGQQEEAIFNAYGNTRFTKEVLDEKTNRPCISYTYGHGCLEINFIVDKQTRKIISIRTHGWGC